MPQDFMDSIPKEENEAPMKNDVSSRRRTLLPETVRVRPRGGSATSDHLSSCQSSVRVPAVILLRCAQER